MAIALVLAVVILAVVIFGVFWALVWLVPFYAYITLAAYLVWRARQRQKEMEEVAFREVQQQRLFNEQEMAAWNASLGIDRRNTEKLEKAPRDPDGTREPPKK